MVGSASLSSRQESGLSRTILQSREEILFTSMLDQIIESDQSSQWKETSTWQSTSCSLTNTCRRELSSTGSCCRQGDPSRWTVSAVLFDRFSSTHHFCALGQSSGRFCSTPDERDHSRGISAWTRTNIFPLNFSFVGSCFSDQFNWFIFRCADLKLKFLSLFPEGYRSD